MTINDQYLFLLVTWRFFGDICKRRKSAQNWLLLSGWNYDFPASPESIFPILWLIIVLSHMFFSENYRKHSFDKYSAENADCFLKYKIGSSDNSSTNYLACENDIQVHSIVGRSLLLDTSGHCIQQLLQSALLRNAFYLPPRGSIQFLPWTNERRFARLFLDPWKNNTNLLILYLLSGEKNMILPFYAVYLRQKGHRTICHVRMLLEI